jgi:hypothetical protein
MVQGGIIAESTPFFLIFENKTGMCLFYETGIHNYRKTHFTENSYGTRNP